MDISCISQRGLNDATNSFSAAQDYKKDIAAEDQTIRNAAASIDDRVKAFNDLAQLEKSAKYAVLNPTKANELLQDMQPFLIDYMKSVQLTVPTISTNGGAFTPIMYQGQIATLWDMSNAISSGGGTQDFIVDQHIGFNLDSLNDNKSWINLDKGRFVEYVFNSGAGACGNDGGNGISFIMHRPPDNAIDWYVTAKGPATAFERAAVGGTDDPSKFQKLMDFLNSW